MIEALIGAAVLVMSWLIPPAQAAGHPEIVPYAMATFWYEANWNPAAVGDHGCSLGLWQGNQCGGMGRHFSREQLLDGPTSARLFVEYVAVHLEAGYEIEDILGPWTVRPYALRLVDRMPPDATAQDWVMAVLGR